MSPSPDVGSSRHTDPPTNEALKQVHNKDPDNSTPHEGWIATTVEVQSDLPSEQEMSLQTPHAATKAGHDRQWVPNGSEKSFHSFPSATMSDSSMEMGIPHKKEHGSGVKKDIMALLNLMAIIPFISFGTALYAFFATVLALMSLPIRLCVSTRPPFTTQLSHHLLPALNLHFKSAYSSRRYYPPPPPSTTAWPGTMPTSSPQSRDSDHTNHTDTTNPSLSRLLAVLFASSIISLPIAISAFVLAIFWMLSALTTDETADTENGRATKGTLDDGRWLAKRLRRWWVRWLSGELFGGRGKTRTKRNGARSSRR